MKGFKHECQLMERCDGPGGDVRDVGRCDSCQEL